MQPDEFDMPADFEGVVRLFPLPNFVMYPSNVVPLHIFESRYREMIEDALAGDQLITMATLKPGYDVDYYSRPEVADGCCIGRVVTHLQKDNGTYDLVLVGLRRAMIEQELTPPRAFRRAFVRVLQEQPSHAAGSRSLQLGRELIERLVQVLPALEKLAGNFQKGNISLNVLTDTISFHVPLELDVKLGLLTETDPVKRAALLLTKFEHQQRKRRRTRQAPPASFPPPFGEN